MNEARYQEAIRELAAQMRAALSDRPLAMRSDVDFEAEAARVLALNLKRREAVPSTRRAQAIVSAATPSRSLVRAARPAAQLATAEEKARASLLASRPDFGSDVKNILSAAPLAIVRHAVNTFSGPNQPTATELIGKETTTMSTNKHKADGPPKSQTLADLRERLADPEISQAEKDAIRAYLKSVGEDPDEVESNAKAIARAMGGAPASRGIIRKGKTLELGFMTPEQARARLKGIEAGGRR